MAIVVVSHVLKILQSCIASIGMTIHTWRHCGLHLENGLGSGCDGSQALVDDEPKLAVIDLGYSNFRDVECSIVWARWDHRSCACC